MSLITTLMSLAAAAALPTAPVDGIRDDARVFSDATRTELVREVAALYADTGVRLFIDTNTYLESGSSAAERSRRLVRDWGQGSLAAVICVDRSSPIPPAIHVSEPVWEKFGTLDVMNALRRVVSTMSSTPVTGEQITAGARLLINDIKKFAKAARVRDRLLNRRDVYLAGAFGAALLLGGGIAWLIVRYLRRHETQQAVQHTFPDVEVGQRFGAPCGGGVIVEIAFRKQ